MARRARRNHTPAFKAKTGLAAIKGEKTMSESAQQFDVHANQIKQWRDQLLEGAIGVFGSEARPEPQAPAIDVKTLQAKIGELTLVNDPRVMPEDWLFGRRAGRRVYALCAGLTARRGF